MQGDCKHFEKPKIKVKLLIEKDLKIEQIGPDFKFELDHVLKRPESGLLTPIIFE